MTSPESGNDALPTGTERTVSQRLDVKREGEATHMVRLEEDRTGCDGKEEGVTSWESCNDALPTLATVRIVGCRWDAQESTCMWKVPDVEGRRGRCWELKGETEGEKKIPGRRSANTERRRRVG